MRLIKLLALTIILTTVIGCSKDVEDVNSDNNKEITIIMSNHWGIMGSGSSKDPKGYMIHLSLLTNEFTKETGIEVNFIKAMGNSHDDYLDKRNTELYLEGGPTLILIGGDEYYDNLVEQGVAVKVEDKLSNYKNIYDVLKDGYFVPMAMATRITALNKERLNELELKLPDSHWNFDEYYKMNDKYFRDSKEQLSAQNIHKILNLEIENMLGSSRTNQEVRMASQETIDKINSLRDYFLTSGNFSVNEKYNYENYYNMLFNFQSDEYKESYGLWEQTRKSDPELRLIGSINALNAIETNNNYNKYLKGRDILGQNIGEEDIALLPLPDSNLYSWGFLVNKNGKNIEEGLAYLDMLLSDESQLKLYRDRDDGFSPLRILSFSAPVVKSIEKDLEEIEVEKGIDQKFINIRKVVLDQIKDGKKQRVSWGPEDNYLKDGLKKLLIEVIFTDEKYTWEEIMNKLKEFDNEMNLMFSE